MERKSHPRLDLKIPPLRRHPRAIGKHDVSQFKRTRRFLSKLQFHQHRRALRYLHFQHADVPPVQCRSGSSSHPTSRPRGHRCFTRRRLQCRHENCNRRKQLANLTQPDLRCLRWKFLKILTLARSGIHQLRRRSRRWRRTDLSWRPLRQSLHVDRDHVGRGHRLRRTCTARQGAHDG